MKQLKVISLGMKIKAKQVFSIVNLKIKNMLGQQTKY